MRATGSGLLEPCSAHVRHERLIEPVTMSEKSAYHVFERYAASRPFSLERISLAAG